MGTDALVDQRGQLRDGGVNGNGWVDTDTPHLIQADGVDSNTLIVIGNGTTASYYNLVNGVYQPRFDNPSRLTYNGGNDTYKLVDGSGDQIVFSGFGAHRPVAQRGEFASITAANGVTMAVTSSTADGHVTEVQRSAVSNGKTVTESFLYAISATMQRRTIEQCDVAHANQRRGLVHGAASAYTYYDGTQRVRRQRRRLDDGLGLGRQGNVLRPATTATTRREQANG